MQKTRKTVKQNAQLRFRRPFWASLIVLTLLTFSVAPALADADAPAADAPAATAAEQDPEAKAILMNMANFIARAPAFSVTIRSGYDAIQEDGQYIEFGEKRNILLQRPDRMRVEVERSDGDQGLILFDGKQITAFKADENVFARVEKPGTVDDTLVYVVRDLQFTLPMARMLHTGFAEQVEEKDHGDQLCGGEYPLRRCHRPSGHPLGRCRYAAVGCARQ